jgi:GxxExxY protein
MEDDITYKIIGCAMKVHSALGNGFQEVIYQRSLYIELKKTGLDCKREFDMPIHYDGIKVGSRRVDFLVGGNISVELKALIKLENVHLAQAMNYLEAYNIETGLRINFGSAKLEFHQLTNKKFKNNIPKIPIP